ncbi:MAG: hypothetical protein MPJ78_18275 [Hyphomicrobiaceae bacterium]|nr:hypothetical protein [Hyphomicrobiaceae bacterium]
MKKMTNGVRKMNLSRVLLGGALSGLVLNIGEYVLNHIVVAQLSPGAGTEPASAEFSVGQIASGVAIMFVFGLALIWIYAAIRPRFGPGPKTAVIAGLAVWSIAWLLTGASFINVGIFPADQMLVSIIWGLVEVPLAAIAGAWLYREDDAGCIENPNW